MIFNAERPEAPARPQRPLPPAPPPQPLKRNSSIQLFESAEAFTEPQPETPKPAPLAFRPRPAEKPAEPASPKPSDEPAVYSRDWSGGFTGLGLYDFVTTALTVCKYAAFIAIVALAWWQREWLKTTALDAYKRLRPVAEQIASGKLPEISVPETTGPVIKVYDGNTIGLISSNRLIVLRLAGTSAPLPPPTSGAKNSKPDDINTEAREFLSSLVLSNDVRVSLQYLSPLGTGTGIVWIGTNNINAALVAAGLATANIESLTNVPAAVRTTIADAEQRARTARRGLWRQRPDPDAPQN
jgi:endonuclease YncB( thermonuclease family)